MISRKGTRSSGAASGEAKIFREEGSGPVVTAGTVFSVLERMFMGSSGLILLCVRLSHGGQLVLRHCERSEAIQKCIRGSSLDCFVARAPRNDEGREWCDH